MSLPDYIGSKEVAEMLDLDLEYFQNKFVVSSGLAKIAYRFNGPKSPRKWDKAEVLAWVATKRVTARRASA